LASTRVVTKREVERTISGRVGLGGREADDSATVPKGFSEGSLEIDRTGGSVRRRGGAELLAGAGAEEGAGAGVAAGSCPRRLAPARTPEAASAREV
jgi:hypothetical protein